MLPASSSDCTIAPASMKPRKLSTCGKPGQVDGAGRRRRSGPRAAAWGRSTIGAASWGRRNVCLTERAPERADHPRRWPPASRRSLGSAARLGRRRPSPSRCSPVLATKTSSSVGSTSSSDSTTIPASSSARTTLATSVAPPSSSTRSLPSRSRQQLAEARAGPRSAALGRRRRASPSSRCGLPTSAFSDAGVPSATMLPAADDPDAVGELVGLLEVLRGQEDGRALVVERARPPPRSPCG